MNQTANRLRHIHNEAAIASQSNPFEVMMNGLKEEFGCVSQRYDAIMDIALFYIADELDELQAKVDDLRKQVPSERERQILDMWPKWSNGDYCMFGDLWTAQPYGEREPKQLTKLSILSPKLLEEWDQAQGENFAYEWDFLRPADTTYRPEKAEPPAPKVLDAAGVEIKVGDTVWYRSLCTMGSMRKAMVTGFDENCLGGKLVTLKDEAGKTWYIDPKKITHVQPDSWERLEMDAELNDETGVVGGNLDIVRRAKKLAGVEVDR